MMDAEGCGMFPAALFLFYLKRGHEHWKRNHRQNLVQYILLLKPYDYLT